MKDPVLMFWIGMLVGSGLMAFIAGLPGEITVFAWGAAVAIFVLDPPDARQPR